jgi:phage terminase large subunit-like protein
MELIALLPIEEQQAVLADMDMDQLMWDWNVWARPEQLAPEGEDWNVWLILAGRGYGKTRLGAEWVREQAKYTTTGQRRFGLVARTAADVRDVIVEGESGIMNISPPSEKPHYEPSKRRLTWPNGNTASLFCVTPDTEALTKDRGWVTHGNLSEGDEILTLNTDTGSSEWNPVKGVHTFDVVDEPVARFSGRHHSSVSTLTHKWPVKLRNGEIKLTTTDSIIKGESHTKVRLITSAPCSDIPTTSTHSDALVELCAWYMTEGSVKSKDFKSKTRSLVLIDQPGWEKWLSNRIAPLRCHKKDGKPKIIKPTSTKKNGAWGMTNLIDICDKLGEDIEDALVFYHQRPRSVSLSIAQSMRVNPDKCASIHKALTDLFGPEREKTKAPGQKIKGESWIVRLDSSGNGALNYYLDNDSSAKILEHFIDPVEKIPTIGFMNSLTVSQLEIFVNACMDGDGHRRGSSGSFEQKSAGRRDAFGYALTLLGHSHSYTTRHSKYKGETVTLYGAHYRGSAYTTLPRAANLQSSKGRAWGNGRSTYTLENYTGIVWCPTAKNKTWLARHDGKVFFTGNTADEPDGLRGPQFSHAWADEIAAWRQTPDSAGMTAFDNLRVGTRLGASPKLIATTTPKRVPLLYKLIEESKLIKTSGSKVVITKGSTLENAGNLSGAYLDTITGVYEGTSLAQQELYGEMLDDVDGALWTIEMIDKARELIYPPSTPLRVIGVDPSVAENPRDACGIVVCASTGDRDLYKRHAWVLEDATIHGSPEVWANKVVEMARRWGAPVVAEVNQGGALVRNAINAIDPSVKVLEVHSKYGKALRAEPIVLAYEQSRIHHVNYLPELESQMTSWIPEQTRSSPDRVDALVHAMTALLIKPPAGFHGGKLTAKSPAARKLPPFRSGGGKVFNPNR